MPKQLNQCPNCSSQKISLWGRVSGQVTLHDSWWRCGQCRLIFASPQQTAEEIKDFYTHEFYKEKTIDPQKKAYARLFQRLTKLILNYQPHPDNYLEIGCGKGLFLKYFSQSTPLKKIVGIEFDKSITDTIQTNTKFQAVNDYYESVQLNEKFDTIFCWHVIEHVIDIHAFIKKLREDSSGIVVIGTPAFGWLNEIKAFLQRLLRRPVTVGTSSDHTFFFSQKILRELLEKHGFSILYSSVYVDNVNEEMNLSARPLKAFILQVVGAVMALTRWPLFGKQLIIARRA